VQLLSLSLRKCNTCMVARWASKVPASKLAREREGERERGRARLPQKVGKCFMM